MLAGFVFVDIQVWLSTVALKALDLLLVTPAQLVKVTRLSVKRLGIYTGVDRLNRLRRNISLAANAAILRF